MSSSADRRRHSAPLDRTRAAELVSRLRRPSAWLCCSRITNLLGMVGQGGSVVPARVVSTCQQSNSCSAWNHFLEYQLPDISPPPIPTHCTQFDPEQTFLAASVQISGCQPSGSHDRRQGQARSPGPGPIGTDRSSQSREYASCPTVLVTTTTEVAEAHLALHLASSVTAARGYRRCRSAERRRPQPDLRRQRGLGLSGCRRRSIQTRQTSPVRA
jgi:hypothetical protein